MLRVYSEFFVRFKHFFFDEAWNSADHPMNELILLRLIYFIFHRLHSEFQEKRNV